MKNELKNNNGYDEIMEKLQFSSGKNKKNTQSNVVILPLIVFLCLTLTITSAIFATKKSNSNSGVLTIQKPAEYHANYNNTAPNIAQNNNVPTTTTSKEDKDVTAVPNSKIKDLAVKAMNDGNYEKAILLLANYLDKSPNDDHAHDVLSNAYALAGNREKAEEHAAIASELRKIAED